MLKNGFSVDLRPLMGINGHPQLSLGVASNAAEAAAICLEDRKHAEVCDIAVIEGRLCSCGCLSRPQADTKIRRSHFDMQDATHHGALAIGWLVSELRTGRTVIQQSYKTTGFDYYLDYEEVEPFCLDNAYRLEISGILNGTPSNVASRVKQKVRQTKQSDDRGQPAVICVVEFNQPACEVVVRQ